MQKLFLDYAKFCIYPIFCIAKSLNPEECHLAVKLLS
jgi:hypothetical protein